MSELEIVLMFAWLVTLYLWHKAHMAVKYLRTIIFEIGHKEAFVEIDEEHHIVHIIRK